MCRTRGLEGTQCSHSMLCLPSIMCAKQLNVHSNGNVLQIYLYLCIDKHQCVKRWHNSRVH